MIFMPEIQKLSIPERLESLEHIWESLTADNAAPDLAEALIRPQSSLF